MSEEKKSRFIKVVKFLFPPKNEKENIFQYIIRQFYLCDTSGRPSLTVTILVYVMALVGIVTGVILNNSMFVTQMIAADGAVSINLFGIPDAFIYFVIGLSVVITGWYRQKQNKVGSDEPGEVIPSGIINTIKEFITSKIASMTGGASTAAASTQETDNKNGVQ